MAEEKNLENNPNYPIVNGDNSSSTNGTKYRRSESAITARVRFLNEFNGPKVLQTIYLTNSDIRELFRRHFDMISKQYFFAWHFSGYRGQRTEYIKASKQIRNTNQEIIDELIRRQNVAEELLLSNNVKAVASERVILEREVPVVTPHAGQFIEILTRSDKLMSSILSLWQAGIVDDGQYDNAIHEIRESVRGLHKTARLIANAMRDRLDQIEKDRKDRLEGNKEIESVNPQEKVVSVDSKRHTRPETISKSRIDEGEMVAA